MKRDDLETIKQLIAEKNFKDAISALQSLDASGDASAESQYLLGTIYHRLNKLGEAVQAFKRSLLLDPNFTDSAISLSVIYNDTGHYKEAAAIFEQAQTSVQSQQHQQTTSILLDKEIAQHHIKLGDLYRRVHRFDAAANEYLKAKQLDPKNIAARVNLAKTLAQRGQMKLAHRELSLIIEEHPNYTPARVNLALLYYSQGNTIDARIELQNALRCDPGNEQIETYIKMTEKATESTVSENAQ